MTSRFTPIVSLALILAMPTALQASASAGTPVTAAIEQPTEPVTARKRELALELIALSGADALADQVYAELTSAFMRMASPELRPILTDVVEEARANRGELIALMAEVYARQLTEQELEDVIAFHRTASGRSLIQKTPAILAETLAIGRQWGEQQVETIFERMEQQRVRKTEGVPPPAPPAPPAPPVPTTRH